MSTPVSPSTPGPRSRGKSGGCTARREPPLGDQPQHLDPRAPLRAVRGTFTGGQGKDRCGDRAAEVRLEQDRLRDPERHGFPQAPSSPPGDGERKPGDRKGCRVLLDRPAQAGGGARYVARSRASSDLRGSEADGAGAGDPDNEGGPGDEERRRDQADRGILFLRGQTRRDPGFRLRAGGPPPPAEEDLRPLLHDPEGRVRDRPELQPPGRVGTRGVPGRVREPMGRGRVPDRAALRDGKIRYLISYSIHVVEDEETFRAGGGAAFGNRYRVRTFPDAESALDAAKSEPPD